MGGGGSAGPRRRLRAAPGARLHTRAGGADRAQTGGRVFLFLATDDFERDFAAMEAAGIAFVRPPADMPYGRVAVWRDLYGNLWDLVQYKDGRP